MGHIYAEQQAYGITEESLKFVEQHRHKLGEIVELQGFLAGMKWDIPGRDHWVSFKDAAGNQIIVSGFTWGYSGEGPHGLLKAALSCGFNITIEQIAGMAQKWGWTITRPHLTCDGCRDMAGALGIKPDCEGE